MKNFKSVKDLTLNCRRVNLFIGEPNTGKSNILEALGLLSHMSYGVLRAFVRFETTSNLFFDQNLEESLRWTTTRKRSRSSSLVTGLPGMTTTAIYITEPSVMIIMGTADRLQ
ncbi:MAG: AAA family ATPase [Candidatus Bathyarchaeia archaeon]